ncbi:TonB-linked outer membrane protein, SusC/RagA family [Solitalea canadensis DSM 3403]|uniref:TonB-linked outer membrane protein, SusC/RagA family n=2 Tax=Solitalea canadensis TaxID=995 RepID=H8KP76_SOLCM|nr:TonB-linked outer membrane protein, SusC/RagA family [Solitalea canadensis DSM 3403]
MGSFPLALMPFGVYSQAYANTFVQSPSEGIQAISTQQKSSVEEALATIKNVYHVNFIYEEGVLNDLYTTIDATSFKGKKLESVLSNLLLPLGLKYNKLDQSNYTIITGSEKSAQSAEKRFGVTSINSIASASINNEIVVKQVIRTITGKVVDANDGLPIPGVSIMIKGTSLAVQTNEIGEFALQVPEGSKTIVFKFIGYVTKEITLSSTNQYLIKLESDTKLLQEVVVTGYQTFSKEHATGSFSTISADKLETRRMVDLKQLLEGQAPGLVNYKGDVSVRGTSTFNAIKNPLYVIDGFPVEKTTIDGFGRIEDGVPDINPEDIESITVLKDAAAASIYGARAANGVIVITTKRAKAGETKVNFSSSISMRAKPDLSYMNTSSANTMIGLEEEYINNNPELKTNPLKEVARIRDAGISSPVINILLSKYAGEISPDEAVQQINALRSNGNVYQEELSKYAMQNVVQQQYNLSLAKATDKNSFNLSATYWNNQNTSLNDKNDRLGINITNSVNIAKWLKADVGAYVGYGKEDNPGLYSTSLYNSSYPYEHLVDENGNPIIKRNSLSRQITDNVAKYNLYNIDSYTLDELNYNIGHVKNFTNRLFGKLNATVTPWLKYDLMFQYETSNTNTKTVNEWEAYDTRYLVNSFAVFDAVQNKVVYKLPAGNILNEESQISNSYTLRNQLNFTKKLGTQHNLSVVAGSEIRQAKNERTGTKGYGYNPELLTTMPINLEELSKTYAGLMIKAVSLGQSSLYNHQEVLNRFASFYGNATYTFSDKYSVTGSARMDLSNLFGTNPSYQYRPLWSAGASWLINREKFFNVSWVNYLKLRASYGLSGNIAKNVGPYLVASYGISNYTKDTYGTVVTPPNPNLRWEKTHTINMGLDFVLFHDVLQGSIDVYRKRSIDLLANLSLDPSLGYDAALVNNGELLNQGIELTLSSDVVKNRNFRWNLSVNAGYNHNEIVRVDYTPKSASELLSEGSYLQGNPLQGLYAYKYAGLNAEGNPLIYNEKGEVVYAQVTNPNAVYYMGSLIPLVSGSFTNNLNYKGFELSAMLIYNIGQKMRNDVPTITNSYGGLTNEQIANRWQNPGDELITDIPRYTFHYEKVGNNFRNNNYRYGDAQILDASYIKLRNVSLSYNLPKAMINKYGLNAAKLRFMVENPVGIGFNGNGIDVEAYNQASGSRSIKPQPTFVVGLNVGF